MKNTSVLLLLLFLSAFAKAQTTDPQLLVNIQKASQVEIDAYNISDLEIGMLVYNTDENRIYEYTNTGFLEILTAGNIYTGSFIISAAGTTTITGIPFQPSQITFVAHANVGSTNINGGNGQDNGTENNDFGLNNSYGTMNGFVNNVTGSLVQQVIYVGGSGNSINDISRYASSTKCIGLRYGDQNGNDLGRISGSFGAFTADGFTLNITYDLGTVTGNLTNAATRDDVRPTDILAESVLVMYTAYK